MIISPNMDRAWRALQSIQRQCWEQGLASQAALALGKTEEAVMMAHDSVLRQGEDGRFSLIENTIAIVDPAASGSAVIHAYNITGEEKYKTGLNKMTDYLLNRAPRSPEGVLYQLTDRNQVWIDSFGMAPPYLAMMGEIDAAMDQIYGLIELLWNKEKCLFSHMYDADKKDFEREAFWTSGNGWALYGMITMLSILDGGYLSEKELIIGYFRKLIDSMRTYQLQDGLMYDVIDDPGTFVETNGAQMYAYAVYKGIKLGYLDTAYRQSADKALRAARRKVDKYGFVQGAAGSPDFVKPGTSAEAQVFYLLMEVAAQE